MNKMNTAIKDGGPAFPHAQRLWDNDAQSWAVHSVGGMTLRDYFAGQALAGALQNYTTSKFGCTEKEVALGAYRYADAMLAARKEGEQ
jgi:hypothetical protein